MRAIYTAHLLNLKCDPTAKAKEERKWKNGKESSGDTIGMAVCGIFACSVPDTADRRSFILQRNRSNTERRNPKGACFQTEIYGMMALSGFSEGQFGLRLRKTVIYICSD